MEHHTIKFNLNGKPKTFEIVHNLKEFGLDIEAAFVNFTVRTTKFSEWSFCNYVKSKDRQIKCMPKFAFDRLKNDNP